jgi:DNA-binding SARP family transcriptional activator
METSNPLHVNLLGPLEMRMNGRCITPTARKPRQVLAMLAVHNGQLVTVDAIVDELWGMSAPRAAVQTIQTYILRLRQQIREVAPETDASTLVVTRPCGYSLDIPDENVDAHRFDDLATRGERAVENDDYETAARVLTDALDLWRGPALVDVPYGTQLGIEVARLVQSRLSALESRIEADLTGGHHHQLLAELAELTTRYPMHERLCTQYMTALSRSGMKWRALEIFWALRENLVEELGVEPSLEVQRLQRQILRGGDTNAELAVRTLTKSG